MNNQFWKDTTFAHAVRIFDQKVCNRILGQSLVNSPGYKQDVLRIETIDADLLRKVVLPKNIDTPRSRRLRVIAETEVKEEPSRNLTVRGYSQENLSNRKRFNVVEAEVQFELRRRSISPSAPSRLESIFLADNDPCSRRELEIMTPFRTHILRTKIVECQSATRCDRRWFELFLTNPQSKFIDAYWRNEPRFQHTCTWEYLVDGIVSFDAEDLQRLIQKRRELCIG